MSNHNGNSYDEHGKGRAQSVVAAGEARAQSVMAALVNAAAALQGVPHLFDTIESIGEGELSLEAAKECVNVMMASAAGAAFARELRELMLRLAAALEARGYQAPAHNIIRAAGGLEWAEVC